MMRNGKRNLVLLSVISGIVLIQCCVFAEEAYTVKRKHALLRTGPGSFYPCIAELPQGTAFRVLEEQGGWYRVSVEDTTGYVSTKVTEGEGQKADVFSRMAGQRAGVRVSEMVMSAGVKGFGEKFSKRLEGDPNFVAYSLAYQIDYGKYEQFREETYRGFDIRSTRGQIELEPCEEPTFFTFSEEGMGLGIASKIAQIGLYGNKAVQDYVNYVANLVVEASDAYDICFKFFILDTPYMNGYSCPGGIVFITKGMLRKVESEAELACVLGHEIAHVARYHGMKESEERKGKITADDAFMELSDEFGESEDDDMAALDKELEDVVLAIYDQIFAGRLAEYEEEADRLGVLFAARAGYDPHGMVDLLTRIGLADETSNNEHYTKDQVASRKELVARYLNSRKWPGKWLTKRDRLQQRLSSLK